MRSSDGDLAGRMHPVYARYRVNRSRRNQSALLWLAVPVVGAALAFAPATARAEYNSPSFPKFPVQEPPPPADGSPERTFLALPAGSGAEPQASAVTGDFTEFRPTPKRSPEQLAATLQEADRLRAMNNLERAKALDDELIRVRQMLNEKNRQEQERLAQERAEAAPAVENAAPVAPAAPTGVPSVETESVSRLLSSVQGDDASRRSERARLQLLRESLTRKQRRDSAYTRAAGGSNFQAALEFNSALRGSSSPSAEAPRNRLAERAERPANRQLFPVDTPDSMLLMHKFRAVDLSIDGKAAQVPDDRRHQLKGGEPYDANIKDPLPSMVTGGGSSGGGLILGR